MTNLKEWASIKIAWMLPKRVVMWCFYQMTAHATGGKYGNTLVPGLSWETIVDRWIEKC